jgi:hypothetical protein
LYMAEKAAQLFAALRCAPRRGTRVPAAADRPAPPPPRLHSDLPSYGPRRHWQPLLQRTFEVYAKVRAVAPRRM